MTRALQGTAVWCTRPGRAGERSCARLYELGATVHHAPTVRISAAVPAAPDLAALHRTAADSVLALTSPTSASNFIAAVGAVRPDGTPWRAVAVGQKTAIQARGLGIDVLATAARATGRDLVPCVLGASRAPVVVIPGSNLRRPELASGLRDGGREVLELLVQETVPLEGLPPGLPADLSGIDLLVAYSPSALAFARSLGGPSRRAIEAIPLAALGPTTAAEGRAVGFTVAVEPADPHEDNLIDQICRWAAARG